MLTIELCGILLEFANITGARSKHVVGRKVGRDELVDRDVGWGPARTVDTTVEPPLGTIGSALAALTVAASTVRDMQETARVVTAS